MANDKPWPQVPVGNKQHGNAAVVIIGGGISGMCTAIDLVKRNNCRNFVILERSSGVGGTWYDNKYPGCCCDVWSMLYSYSFAQKSDWTREYPGQEEILAYLTDTAQKYNLYQHVRFNSAVESARWDDAEKKWKTKVTVAKGSKQAEFTPEYEITSDFLVSAVGQLNVPRLPETIPGYPDFSGKLMHSARWDWSYELQGKRIGVIGNGATAVQIIPEIAKVASQVTVYQRSPNWVVPRLDSTVSPLSQTLYKYLPPLRWRKRAGQMDYRENFFGAVSDGEGAVATEIRRSCAEQLRVNFPNQPEMWEKLTPDYAPLCKRVIISDDYYPALARDNVRLENRKISKITSTGIEVEGGSHEEIDLLVCATGFQTLDFMHPIKINGRNGRALNEIWSDGARAYNGVTVEDLPNFGMLYGPNTNLGHNSIILMIEAESRYINALVAPVLAARRQGKTLALRPKKQVLDAYNAEIQKTLSSSAFADPKCNSWYKNDKGVITNNWSGTVVDYQIRLSDLNWDDYEVEGTGKDILGGKRKTHIGRVQEETTFSDLTLTLLGAVSVAAVAAGYLARNAKYLEALRVR